MPPRASSRLTLYVLPGAEDQLAAHAVREELGSAALSEGGERELRAEVFDRERFLANGQGGFRVRCPASGAPLVRDFAAALERWRAGGSRTLRCACGAEHDLASLECEPPVAFARQWLKAVDAASIEVSGAATSALDRCWPGWTSMGSRG